MGRKHSEDRLEKGTSRNFGRTTVRPRVTPRPRQHTRIPVVTVCRCYRHQYTIMSCRTTSGANFSSPDIPMRILLSGSRRNDQGKCRGGTASELWIARRNRGGSLLELESGMIVRRSEI